MNSLGRKNDGKEKKSSAVFTKETLGVVLILFATLLLLCLITRDSLFSAPGQYVNAFLFGCFGYYSFILTGLAIFWGVLLIADKKLGLSVKQKTFISLTVILTALLAHVVTMRGTAYTYGEYLSQSYLMAGAGGVTTCSGGGFFIALVAYPLSALLSDIGCYVVFSVLILISGYATVMAFLKDGLKRPRGEKFRSSYVKTETEEGELEVKDYPVAGVEFASEEEKKPAQKLFINDGAGFGFKSNRELKNEDKNVGYTLNPSANNGIRVAGTTAPKGTSSYNGSYSAEMQQRLDYIKKPAEINLNQTQKSSYGVNISKPIPRPITPVNDVVTPTVNATPIEPIKPAETTPPATPTIPLYEHDEGAVQDSAASHAQSFSSAYAEIEDVETVATPAEPVETFHPARSRITEIETPSRAIPVIEETASEVIEPAVEPIVEPTPSPIIEEPILEEPVIEQVKEETPPPVIETRSRSRRSLFGDEKEEKTESVGFTSRVNADNNGGSRRSIFEPESETVEEVKEEPVVEKEPVPINREYFRPPFDIFENYAPPVNAGQENHQERMEIIQKTLEEFRINAVPQSYIQGPAFTRYEISMPAGISVKKVLGYDDDLKMRLKAKDGVRIEAPIPGKDLVGIEVANTIKTTVGFKDVMEGLASSNKKGSLMFAIGKDIVGNSISYDLAKGPHYLVAGATGSGKSVCLHVMIVSLIMRYSPEELKLVLVDPKSVEFRKYDHIPHLLVDEIITDAKRAITLLQWAYDETNRRNDLFTEFPSVSNIDDYNSQIASDTVPKLPRIVFVIDELADLMEASKKDLEEKIRKIAAKSRSAGIHLVLATQRPSVDVVTGTIKANLPSRIALRVMNFQDSQTILSEAGAEKLLGNGDMLYKDSSMSNYERYQGAYISGREITKAVEYIKENNKAYFDEGVKDFLEKETRKPAETESSQTDGGGSVPVDRNSIDDFFLQALSLAVRTGTISISQLQRRFGIGYARAGGLVDKMERLGFISGNEGSKARKVLLTIEEYESKFGNLSD